MIRLFSVMLALHLPVASRAAITEYVVAGGSMSPALVPGDKVVVESGDRLQMGRGELVAIKLRSSPTPLIKRVAAVPGDRIRFEEHSLFVNGQKTRAIDPRAWRSTIRQLERYGNRVPDGFYLVLGDNHLVSKDSGKLGLISHDQFLGRVVKVLKASPESSAK